MYISEKTLFVGTFFGCIYTLSIYSCFNNEIELRMLYPNENINFPLKQPISDIKLITENGHFWLIVVFDCILKIILIEDYNQNLLREFPMVLIPDGLGQISQVVYLNRLQTLIVSTQFQNHCYIDLKLLFSNVENDGQNVSIQVIGKKNVSMAKTGQSDYGSCICQKQLFCSKSDSALQQINPPSTVISQTMVFKSRRTNIKFGKLFELQAPGCLASVCENQVVVMDMQNHRLVQFINFDNQSKIQFLKQGENDVVLILTSEEENVFELEVYLSMTLKEHFDQNLLDLSKMGENADFGKIERIMKSVVENEVLQTIEFMKQISSASSQNSQIQAIFQHGENIDPEIYAQFSSILKTIQEKYMKVEKSVHTVQIENQEFERIDDDTPNTLYTSMT